MNQQTKQALESLRITKELEKFDSEELNMSELTGIAIYPPRRTGFDKLCLYVSMKEGKHGPRIKLALNNKELKNRSFSVSISNTPEIKVGHKTAEIISSKAELEKVFKWVKDNKDVLMKMWNGEYDDVNDLSQDLKNMQDQPLAK